MSQPFMFALVLLSLLFAACEGELSSSFLTPKDVGVKWRYWVQDGNINMDDLAADFAAISSIGSYGVELLPYQSYGFPTIEGDIGISGYGSVLYKQFVDTSSSLALDYNLTLDHCVGPSQGAGIPSQNPDTPGFNTELAFGWTFVKMNEAFQGPLPPPLVIPLEKYGGDFAPVFNVTTARLESVIVAALAPNANLSFATILLDFRSLTDVSTKVSNSTLSLSPVVSDSVIIAFYSRRNGYQEAYGNGKPSPSLPASWGAFVVDHFSAEGANTIDRFTFDYLFNPPSSALKKVTRLIWEDSMEFRAQLFWTPSFMQRFSEHHQYNATLALPAFYSRKGAAFGGVNLPSRVFAFSDSDLNDRFFFDYRDTLTALYMEYIATRNRNAASLGYRLSLQPAYGFPLDVAAAASMVSVPEIETLAFDTVDKIRQASGGSHLAGARILSTEFGAEQVKTYAQTMSELINLANIQFAGGVNQLVFHGFPHNGRVSLTTWPGFTPFSFVYSEMHGPRQPAWGHYSGYMAYFNRAQYVLQKGDIGKVDIAIYRHEFSVAATPLFASNVLQMEGYSYEYISPHNLQLALATVANKRLGPPGYKALILVNQNTILASAAAKILLLAQSGLPIIFIGNTPDDIPGYDPTSAGKNAIRSTIAQLIQLSNVRRMVSYNDLPTVLTQLGVRPAAAIVNALRTDQLYSVRRHHQSGVDSHNDYYWLYNAGNVVLNVSINFETVAESAVPFYLDSWTGEIRSIIPTSRPRPGNTHLSGIYLYPKQSVIFAFTNAANFEGIVVANAIGDAVRISHYSFTAAAPHANSQARSVSTIGGWQLNMTAYSAPSDLAVYRSNLNTFGPLSLGDTLRYFNSNDILAGNTSGIATYTTSFLFNSDPVSVVALLDLSAAAGAVSHTATVRLNDRTIAVAIDPATQLVELPSSILIPGKNSLTLQIGTTLLNALNTVPPTRISTLGGNRLSGLPFVPPNTNNGIQGKIQMITFPNGKPTPSPPSTTNTPSPTTNVFSSAAFYLQPTSTMMITLLMFEGLFVAIISSIS